MAVQVTPTGSNASRKQPLPACLPKMNPFFANMPIYLGVAKTLKTNVDFLLALSSKESGWLNAHNQGLHNLFGVTKAGGNNLNFPTYQAAALCALTRYFVAGFRPTKKTPSLFFKVPLAISMVSIR